MRVGGGGGGGAGAYPRHSERGKGFASFLLRIEADKIGFASLLFFFLSMRRVGGGVYKESASVAPGSDVRALAVPFFSYPCGGWVERV